MKQAIFVSGLHSGPYPGAGLGVARSLRAAFPAARVLGVDYWAGSSGLQHEVFDAIWLKPSWDLIEEELYASEIRGELDGGAFWIPTIEREVAWLARNLPDHPRLLGPNERALGPTRKPRPSVAELLSLALPPSLDLAAADETIHAFCRAHSWQVWVKGPVQGAVAVKNWRELEQARAALGRSTGSRWLSVQAHVRGYRDAICFAALQGELLDAVYMQQRIGAGDGVTWAGHIDEVPDALLGALESATRAIGWNGGGEIELVRDADERLWLLDFNPVFSSWVHAATLAGRNLPAALVRRALDLPHGRRALSGRCEFTRAVVELPVQSDLPLPLTPEPAHDPIASDNPYGAALSPARSSLAPLPPSSGSALSRELEADLAELARVTNTPERLLLTRTAEAAFARLDATRSVDGTRLHYAYSLKNSPDPEYLALARRAGMLAECSSLLEVRRALEAGFPRDGIVLNGPGKWWPSSEPQVDGLHAVFCDSIEELERLLASRRSDRLWGVRLRVPGFPSRFGVSVDDPRQFERLCAAVSELPGAFGVQLYLPSSSIGLGHWHDAMESAVVWAGMLEQSTGRRVRALDLGGGYHPDDFPRIPFADIVREARETLSELASIYIEPGRALTQATMAVVTRVLDVRRRGNRLDEVVVDASIAELPLASAYPHRVFRLAGERPLPVGRGATRVLGRICVEDDVLSEGLDLPDSLAVGDRLIWCDAGAYERSQSYAFGRAGYT